MLPPVTQMQRPLSRLLHSPDQSSSTGHHSVGVILISSNMVDVRQNKFYSGLHEHHIR